MQTNSFLFDINCPNLKDSLSKLGSMLPSDEPFFNKNKELSLYLLLRYLGYYWSIVKDLNLFETHNDLIVFDTGLVNKQWDPFYCVISKSKDCKHSQHYNLVGFYSTREGEGKILTKFKTLPSRPTLYTSLEQLHYHHSHHGISVDIAHLMDRISRAKLRTEFLTKIQAPNCKLQPSDGNAYYEELREHLKKDPLSEMILRSTLERSVKLAIKRAAADPFCAAPCYNPRLKEVTLLLPLSITSDTESVDCCLVVSTKNEQYVGVTLLSLEEAYANARLMGRFSSSWLSNRN